MDTVQVIKSGGADGEAERILDGDDAEKATGLEAAKRTQQISKGIKDGKIDAKLYRGEQGYAAYHKLSEE